MPTRKLGRSREAHPEVWEGSGGPLRGPRGVGMGQKAHPVVHDGTSGLSGGPVGIGRPTRRFWRGCEAYPEGRERLGSPPRDWSEVHPGGLGGVGSPFRRSGWPSRLSPDLRVGL